MILGFIIIVVLLFIIFLFLIYPGKVDQQKLSELLKRNYAHRGLHDKEQNIAENSLQAFQQAVANGYGMELDVRLTKDHQVVVFHDDTLKRMCGIDDPVEKYTFQQLQDFPFLIGGERIPLFQKVLNCVNGETPMIVELKHTQEYSTLCQLTYDLLKAYPGTYCIESFDPRIVAWFRKNAPEVIRGQLASNHMKNKTIPWVQRVALTNLLCNVIARPHFIAYHHADMSNFVYRLVVGPLHAVSVAWTIRSQEQYQLQQERGTQMIIFENFRPPIRY